MPTVWLDMCERYPVYTIQTGPADWLIECELTQDEIDFVVKARKEYYKAQRILEKAYEGNQMELF